MQKYLEKTGEMTFDKIFNQRLGMVHFLLSFHLTETVEQACFIAIIEHVYQGRQQAK